MNSAGKAYVVYQDADGTQLADIQTLTGVPLSGSKLSVTNTSLLPLFLGPDNGSVQLYVRPENQVGETYPISARDRVTRIESSAVDVATALASETTTRTAAIAQVVADLVAETAARSAAVAQVATSLATETSARSAAIAALNGSTISFAPTSDILATNVQAAIQEVANRLVIDGGGPSEIFPSSNLTFIDGGGA